MSPGVTLENREIAMRSFESMKSTGEAEEASLHVTAVVEDIVPANLGLGLLKMRLSKRHESCTTLLSRTPFKGVECLP